jgi:hypothetical protein
MGLIPGRNHDGLRTPARSWVQDHLLCVAGSGRQTGEEKKEKFLGVDSTPRQGFYWTICPACPDQKTAQLDVVAEGQIIPNGWRIGLWDSRLRQSKALKEMPVWLSILPRSGRFDNPLRTARMNKNELIECIREINRTAKPDFLSGFTEEQLHDYLEHLMQLDLRDLAMCG